jgi:hypothetical protein
VINIEEKIPVRNVLMYYIHGVCFVVFLSVAAVMGHPSIHRLLCDKVAMLRDMTDKTPCNTRTTIQYIEKMKTERFSDWLHVFF